MRRKLCFFSVAVALLAARPLAAQPCPTMPPNARIGLVLSGGGSFGAFQVGALRQLFTYWKDCWNQTPPIEVVAGTSTGALISPFAFFGESEMAFLEQWYTGVTDKDIMSDSLWNLLKGVSLSDFGYSQRRNCMQMTNECGKKAGRLYCNYKCALRPGGRDLLEELIAKWPDKRAVVTTTDFSTGRSHFVDSSPLSGQKQAKQQDETAFRRAIFASAVPPLIGPAVPLAPEVGSDTTPHYDGGLHSQSPFDAMFAVAAQETPIELTHVILLSSWPRFPGEDSEEIQPGKYPQKAKLRAIADRFNTVFSEAEASDELRLMKAALKLRDLGVSEEAVEELTGLKVRGKPKLVVVAPEKRLGWRTFRFGVVEMGKMVALGRAVAKEVYESNPW